MALPTMRPGLTSREFLRIAGGYNSAALGTSPAGGLDIDNAGNVAADGDLTVDGDVTVGGVLALGPTGIDKTWSRYFGAGTVVPAGASAVTVVTFQAGDVRLPVMDFAQGVEQGASLSVGLPANYDGSALKFTIFWTATAGTSGNVKWNILVRVFGNDESLAQVTTAGGSLSDAFLAQNDLHSISGDYTPAGATSGSFMSVHLRRLGQQDTFDADARFLGLRIAYA